MLKTDGEVCILASRDITAVVRYIIDISSIVFGKLFRKFTSVSYVKDMAERYNRFDEFLFTGYSMTFKTIFEVVCYRY